MISVILIFISIFSLLEPAKFDEMMTYFEAIKAKFDESNLKLSITISDFKEDYSLYHLSILAQHVEFITFRSNFGPLTFQPPYKMENAIERFSEKYFEDIIKKFVDLGVPSHKIVMSISLRGAGYFTADGRYKKMYERYEFCQPRTSNKKTLKNAFKITFDASGSPLPIFKNNDITVIAFTPRMILKLIKNGLEHGVGGFEIASIDSDDCMGICSISTNIFNEFKPAKFDNNRLNSSKFQMTRMIRRAIAEFSNQ